MASGTGGGLLHRLGAVRRVLVLRPGRIGDHLCSVPALRALRLALPDAELVLVGLPWAEPIVARSDILDRFVAFPGWPGIAEQRFEPRQAARWVQAMQAEEADLVVQLYGSGVNANPLALLLGGRATAGFVRPGDGPGLLDASVPLPDTGAEADRVLALPRHLGAPEPDRHPSFPLLPGDHDAAERLLEGLVPPVVAVHPAASDAARRWPPAQLADAVRAVLQRTDGNAVVLGGPGEREQAETVAALVGDHCRVLAGHATLVEAAAVLTRAAVLLTTDSGPAHLAYALGTPSVTGFGDSDPERWGPPAGGPHRVVRFDARPAAVAALALDVVRDTVAPTA